MVDQVVEQISVGRDITALQSKILIGGSAVEDELEAAVQLVWWVRKHFSGAHSTIEYIDLVSHDIVHSFNSQLITNIKNIH